MSNKHMSKTLINLGMVSNKSLILRFPSLNIIPENIQNHFIRGYFDGDGCIYKDKGKSSHTVSIVSTLGFCQEFCNIMIKQLDIKPYISETGRKNGITHTAKFRGNVQIKRFKDYIYDDCEELFLERKKIIFDAMG